MSEKPALIPPEQFNEILRIVRETIRAEMRAERDARREAYAWGRRMNANLAASDAAFNPHGVEV